MRKTEHKIIEYAGMVDEEVEVQNIIKITIERVIGNKLN